LLGVIAVGLSGYVVWRFVQAIADPEHKGSDAKGIVTRIGYVISGLAYAGLALTAVQLILGRSNADNNQTQDWTARLIAQPFGPWLVGIVGAVIVGVGLYQFYQSYTAKFREKLRRAEMSAAEETWVTRLGRFGLAARGVVFVIIGIFLIRAAMQINPSAARGLGGALATLAQQPFGPWLLGVVAAGLIAYGIYMLALARYRQMMTRTNM
jgi:Na+/proline symporter